MLHYFHSVDRESASPPNIACLSQAAELATDGLETSVRIDPTVIRILDAAIGSFLSAIEAAHLVRSTELLPRPDLAPLRAAGIPTVTDEEYQRSAKRTSIVGPSWRPSSSTTVGRTPMLCDVQTGVSPFCHLRHRVVMSDIGE